MKTKIGTGIRWAALLGALAFLALSLAPRAADAQGPVNFGIRPARSVAAAVPDRGYFTHTLEPGAQANDVAVVLNGSSDPVNLTLYAADGITAINGSVAFGGASDEHHGTRHWLSAGVSELNLAPGESLSVPFTISVPSDALPGDHVAGWVVEGPPKTGGSGGVNLTVLERVGVAVVVRVPGPVHEQLILGTMCLNQETGSHYVEMTVGNAGNVLTTGVGSLRIETNDQQQIVDDVPIDLGSIVPGDTTLYRADLPAALEDGDYVATTTIQQSGGRILQASTSMTVAGLNTNGCKLFREVAGTGPDTPMDTVTKLVSGGDFPWLLSGLITLVLLLLALLVARKVWARRARVSASGS